MIEKIEKLRHSGDVDGALGKISELLRNDRSTDAIRYAAFFIIDNAVYDRFGEALDLLKEYTTQNTTDSQAFRAMAYTAWVNRNPSLCEEAVKKAININHSDPQSYLILGMSYLTENRIFEALTTLGTGMLFSADRNNFIPWMKLTTLLFKGITSVSVKFDGTTYIMPLSCFNGQAMEASAIYVNGNYCETEELLLIRDKVGPCRNIVEVGA